jgi:hypothetical protein
MKICSKALYTHLLGIAKIVQRKRDYVGGLKGDIVSIRRALKFDTASLFIEFSFSGQGATGFLP